MAPSMAVLLVTVTEKGPLMVLKGVTVLDRDVQNVAVGSGGAGICEIFVVIYLCALMSEVGLFNLFRPQ